MMAIHIPWIWLVVIFFIVMWWQHLHWGAMIFIYLMFVVHQWLVYEIPTHVKGKALVVDVESLTYQMRYTLKMDGRRFHLISNEAYELGQIWAIEANVMSYTNATQPFGFNFKDYFFSQGIDGKLDINNIIFIKQSVSFWQIRHNIKDFLLQHHQEVLVGFLWGEDFIDESHAHLNIDYLFKASGIYLNVVLEWMHVDRKKKWFGTLLLMGLLYLQAFRISLLRFVFMKMLKTLLEAFRYDLYQPLVTLFVWVLWMLISPRMTLHFGFQISMLIILLFQLMQPSLQKQTPIQRSFFMSFMVLLIVLPFQGEISLLRMIWLPILMLILIKTWWMLLLLSSVLVVFSIDFFKYIATLFDVLLILDDTFYIGVMSSIFIIIFVLSLFFLVQQTWKKAYISVTILAIMFALHVVIMPFNEPTTITFLDVGQGDTTLLSSKNCKIVVDAFDTSVNYIKHIGISVIDYLFLTHSDNDHIKEANTLIESFEVRHVIGNPYDDYALDSPIQRSTLRNYQCGAFELEILSPDDDYFNSNDNSLVLKIQVEGVTLLMMGDASKEVEKDLIETYQDRLKVDMLKVGHHGSNTSTSYEFIEWVFPQIAIVSVGRNNRYGMPHEEVLYALNHIKTYRTDKDGSIIFTFKNGQYTVKSYAP
jgi:competence protein ComEC